MLAAYFWSTLFLALAVRADTFPKLAFTKNYRAPGRPNFIVDRDRRRINYIMGRDIFEVATSTELLDDLSSSYLAQVGVGCPPTNYSLVLDTGSSNTWVGAGIPYVVTSSSEQTRDSVAVNYGSGNFSGIEVLDTVTIGPGLVVDKQSIGVATKVFNISGVDGILGIGPPTLTSHTLQPDVNSTINTVLMNLRSQGKIPKEVMGISFEPTTNTSVNATQWNGEITWGGVDSTKFIGDIQFVPLTSTFPASNYYGINSTVAYGKNNIILPNSAGIVDTGTTLVLLSNEAYRTYQAATGGIFDRATGLLIITSKQYNNLKSLYFHINGISEAFELTPNAQIWARSQDIAAGGTTGSIYLVVSNLGSLPGNGLEFILGQKFLERYFSVYDLADSQFGLALTKHTFDQSN